MAKTAYYRRGSIWQRIRIQRAETGSLTGCGDNAAETNNAGSTADSSAAASDPASAGSDTGSAAGGENAAAGLPVDYTQAIIDNYNGQLEVYNAGYANSDCKFAVIIKSSSELQQTLCELYAEYRDQLVTCPPDQFDALYEELSAKYLEAGYQQVIDERREAYEKGYTTKLQ